MQNTEVMTGSMVDSSMRRALIFWQMTFIIPVTVLFLLVLTAIFAPVLAPYSPTKISLTERLLPPFFVEGGSTAHILGTDKLGRDILSRAIYGARISLSVSLLVISITSSIGTIIGIIAGYLGGRLDAIIMRITDVSLCFPALLLAMLPERGLTILLALVVLSGVALTSFGWIPVPRRRNVVLAGAASGVLGTATAIGGPPMVLVWQRNEGARLRGWREALGEYITTIL